MAWSYVPFHRSNFRDIFNEQRAHLATLDPEDSFTAKPASADQEDGECQGVIFVNPGLNAQAPPAFPPSRGASWRPKLFLTGNNYTGGLYVPATRFLNNNLSPAEAFWAKVDFTNADGQSGALMLWYYSNVDRDTRPHLVPASSSETRVKEAFVAGDHADYATVIAEQALRIHELEQQLAKKSPLQEEPIHL